MKCEFCQSDMKTSREPYEAVVYVSRCQNDKCVHSFVEPTPDERRCIALRDERDALKTNLEAEVARLREALEWYADTFHIMDYCKQTSASTLDVDEKVTHRARQALKGGRT